MGVEALTRVFEYAPHDGMELLVLIALANIADAAGVCWPGHQYLGLYARVKHERNLRQYLRRLEDSGSLYATKVAHRNQRAMYLVATAMSEEEIEQVLIHSFDLHIDEARSLAAQMVEQQCQAEAEFSLPLSELRKNKRKGGGPKRIVRAAKERGIERSAKERGIERSVNHAEQRGISGSASARGIARSSIPQQEGSPDPERGIARSAKGDQTINSEGRSAASERVKSRPDPIMIQHDPNHAPPPPGSDTTKRDGGGGPSATTLYLQEMTDINANVTEEFADLPLDRVRALVEQKRRAGSQAGGLVIALRALRQRLLHGDVSADAALSQGLADRVSSVRTIEARALAIAPRGADDDDVQWLMVYLEEGASDDEALRMLAERWARLGGARGDPA